MAEWLEEGSTAPDFSLPAVGGAAGPGKKLSLKSFRGRPVVLYFYPEDDTPGCTKEACAFRDRSDEFAQLDAVVLGVSGNDVESHQAFVQKYDLNFPLLADVGFNVSQTYGAYREKNLYGKKSMGIQRSTYLIDANGKIARLWKRAIVDGHDEKVLAALRELAAAS